VRLTSKKLTQSIFPNEFSGLVWLFHKLNYFSLKQNSPPASEAPEAGLLIDGEQNAIIKENTIFRGSSLIGKDDN
jgi:hypothetical protein